MANMLCKLTLFSLVATVVFSEPPAENFGNSVQGGYGGGGGRGYSAPSVNYNSASSQNYQGGGQVDYSAPAQSYGTPKGNNQNGGSVSSRPAGYISGAPIQKLSGPTVMCQNGQLMPTAAGMSIIGPCMERYQSNMNCVEYCYAEFGMLALCQNGEIDFDKYISFIGPNFPSRAVGAVVDKWSQCVRTFGGSIDKKDATCRGLDGYSKCLFEAFMLPCYG